MTDFEIVRVSLAQGQAAMKELNWTQAAIFPIDALNRIEEELEIEKEAAKIALKEAARQLENMRRERDELKLGTLGATDRASRDMANWYQEKLDALSVRLIAAERERDEAKKREAQADLDFEFMKARTEKLEARQKDRDMGTFLGKPTEYWLDLERTLRLAPTPEFVTDEGRRLLYGQSSYSKWYDGERRAALKGEPSD